MKSTLHKTQNDLPKKVRGKAIELLNQNLAGNKLLWMVEAHLQSKD